ncbi:glycerate kinase [Liquorilactobacillus nagelii]|uniref:glycerate kinase family protein n=1 Tax=Liquorilactobacillus nagelii TaxID=82688 RepID=UPI0006F18A19|nr:glycerate kinase [Liquorilactobacillus nagelii]KRL40427.1 glycerate kinase [Liquorilactobacillus nagelii DSM 13675]QYH54376.1 glycerate kinase [Liquorilactobacillus nagelii DSM 13675]
MKFVIAPDSFKGSLTAKQAGDAMAIGIKRVFLNQTPEIKVVPQADGGEGTVQSLVDATNGQLLAAKVHDPLGHPIMAHFGILGNRQTAVIEMSAASGLQYVNYQTRDPRLTSTFGTGELILAALKQDVKEIIIGLGGSATNDGGAGMFQALGGHLLDQRGQELIHGGAALKQLARIDASSLNSRLNQVKIKIASDVTNPLVGPQGASYIFGPQKGATIEIAEQLDLALKHYAAIIKQDLGVEVANLPGAGAAGGLGAGLLAFTAAKMCHGIELVIEYTGLKHQLQQADVVLTGEGKIDLQTKFGKTPFGVAQAAKKLVPQAPVIALVGNIGPGIEQIYQETGIDAIFTTPVGAKSLPRALSEAKHDISLTAENVARLIKKMSNFR